MPTPTAYDDLSYESLAYPQTHPDRLAAVATLFGLKPAPVDGCRVLEIGCASGGNLLPMAAGLRASEFVGVDLSAAQIAEAKKCADALRLDNLELHAMGLEEIGDHLGTFDYIIAHAVYSWVPAPVREKLLELMGRLLRPDGVAYLSYNTLPGSQARAAISEMLRYQTRKYTTSAEKLAAARSLLAFWETGFAGQTDPHALAVLEELAQVRELGDFYIAHEYLVESASAFYFHEVIADAAQHGLQFLAEAEVQSMSASTLPQAVRDGLRAQARDIVEAEQHLDFLRNRGFRQTLLCRADAVIKRSIPPDRLLGLHVALAAWPAEDGNGYRDADGLTLRATDEFAKAALEELSNAWPRSLHFHELLARASARTGVKPEAGEVATLANCLIASYAVSRGMELTTLPRHFVPTVSERPQVSALTRWQAAHSGRVTNARHENIVLGPAECALIARLDGTRTVADLARDHGDTEQMLARFAKGALFVG